MIKSEHEREILKPYLIDGWGEEEEDGGIDAHMSMEIKYFRQFHIFFRYPHWMDAYLFILGIIEEGKKGKKIMKTNCRRVNLK